MCSVLDPMMEEVVHLEWHCHHAACSGEAQLGLRSSQSLWELPGCSPSCPSCCCGPRPPTAWSSKESCTPRHSCSHPNHGWDPRNPCILGGPGRTSCPCSLGSVSSSCCLVFSVCSNLGAKLAKPECCHSSVRCAYTGIRAETPGPCHLSPLQALDTKEHRREDYGGLRAAQPLAFRSSLAPTVRAPWMVEGGIQIPEWKGMGPRWGPP